MEESYESTTTTTTSSGSGISGRDQYLKNLNKLSLKISKPVVVTRKAPAFDHQSQNQSLIEQQQSQQPQLSQTLTQAHALQEQQQHQPPVYNINKDDFRDVVQKLTGSPAHERFSTPPPPPPPPIQTAPKAQSSRLHRIRPPPLAHVSNWPPPLLSNAIPPQQAINPLATATAPGGGFIHRSGDPLSPLPPLPSVHGAAESPISAYMRHFQSQNSMTNVDSNPKQFSGFSPLAPLNSPRWNNSAPQQPPQIPLPASTSDIPMTQQQFQLPSSPLAFGCSNSPRSTYPLLSPGLLLSPSSGPLGFPLSPTTVQVPVPSPKWRGL